MLWGMAAGWGPGIFQHRARTKASTAQFIKEHPDQLSKQFFCDEAHNKMHERIGMLLKTTHGEHDSN